MIVCGAIHDLPWRNIWSSGNPGEILNVHLSLLVGCYVPTKVIRVRNEDKPWVDDQCMRAFGFKPEAHLSEHVIARGLTGKVFVRCPLGKFLLTYLEAKRQFSVRNRDVLMNAKSPHKWWSNLKSAVFGLSSSLPPLVSEGGGLVCE